MQDTLSIDPTELEGAYGTAAPEELEQNVIKSSKPELISRDDLCYDDDISYGKVTNLVKIAQGSTCWVYKVDYDNGISAALKVYATDDLSMECFSNEMNIFKNSGISEYDVCKSFKIKKTSNTGQIIIPVIKQPFYPINLEIFIEKLIDEEINEAISPTHALDIKIIIAHNIAKKISMLHKKKITHCDIKPSNILFKYDFNELKSLYESDQKNNSMFDVILCDLGAAGFNEKYPQSMPGTTHYMSPEILLKEGYNKESDWWSYACVVFELLTGQTLFDVHSNCDTLYSLNSNTTCSEHSSSSRGSSDNEIPVKSSSKSSHSQVHSEGGSPESHHSIHSRTHSNDNSWISQGSIDSDEELEYFEYHMELIKYIATDGDCKLEDIIDMNMRVNYDDNVKKQVDILTEIISKNLYIDARMRIGDDTITINTRE